MNKSRLRSLAAGLFLINCGGFAQSNSSHPEFDAAVIKLNKSGVAEQSGGILPGGEFSVTNISMIELLQFAYHVDGSAFSGTIPAWFRSDRFDVVAKGPVNMPDATFRLMLQNLLAKEFRLKVHEDQKPQEAFALVVVKGGPRLQKATGPAAATGPVESNEQFHDAIDHCKRTTGDSGIEADCTSITMTELAKRLPSLAPAYLDRPVVDLTGISGTYDLKLHWVGRGKIDTEGGLTIFDAIQKQLGLRLEQRKIALPGITIDHAERLAEQ